MYGRSVCEDHGTMAGEAQKRKNRVAWRAKKRAAATVSGGETCRRTGGMRIRPPPMFHEAGLPVPAAPAGDETSTYVHNIINLL